MKTDSKRGRHNERKRAREKDTGHEKELALTKRGT